MSVSLSNPFLVLFFASVLSVQAEIALLQQSGSTDEAWPQSFSGGTLFASTCVVEGERKAIPHEIPKGDSFAQSILGNDQMLKAFAFHAASSSATAEYILTILDYGASDGIDTRAEYNPKNVSPATVTFVFTITQTPSTKLFFSFSGTDSLLLKKGHGYVFLISPKSEDVARFYRVTDGTSYPEGACAKGPKYLNPQAFSGSGETRDALFALYTAPLSSGGK